ncbi:MULTISPECIES: LexA family protein [Aerococcus]|uniref:LexA family protein n=1 Tax=Aerococcus TaxID=1375 RepID=UPI0015EB9DB8|nr:MULTISPECIES: XRE family transcriptional regulator [Aerococcus]MDK6290894.1 XRE family transcriptional regulator [Aerococcus urinae]MDK6374737.1 XRE family transcriptional regulator [Aerococcus urinae]MDK6420238.1 XRE family transcriptional regulator [Aerococcus urinae]MDK8074612.1 XRE family transcriptional regulator [Aerococcus urinae]MDK8084041.1 XRE family transcriptional regulator [Aerococcus urinae]
MSELGNRQIMAENIKRLMSKRNISRTKLSDDLGISYTTVSDWINGKTYPRIDKIEALANYFNVEKAELVESEATLSANMIPINRIKNIPIVALVHCGEPSFAEDHIEEYVPFPDQLLPQGDCYFVKAQGDSMNPIIKEDDLVLIKKQNEVENGEIAAVCIGDEDEAALKRVKYSGDDIVLLPENRNYSPIVINKSNPARIIGKAVKVISDLN